MPPSAIRSPADAIGIYALLSAKRQCWRFSHPGRGWRWFLALDSQNRQRVSDAIVVTDADIVVFDPLRDFGIDDLNADAHMTETLREISRVTRRGNARRVPLVIHHALTGKAGIQKVMGFDRSSFGRNSKVLFMWTRAQINVAPVRPDDNSTLIIASGKCSNFTEFEPFAVRLDFDTMLYSRDDDFNVDDWRDSLDNAKSVAQLTLDTISLLPECEQTKNAVIKRSGTKASAIKAQVSR